VVGVPKASAVLTAVFALLFVVCLWNARTYPPGRGYDASHHLAYADLLIHHGEFPKKIHGPTEAETPPAYYAVAGAAIWVGEKIGLGEPARLALALNVLLVAATAYLLLALADLVWPTRPWRWALALAYFAFLPVVVKTAAMFHPETLDLFLSTLALFLAVRAAQRGFEWRTAIAVGIACGLALETRRAALFAFGAIVGGFLAAAALRRDRRPAAAAAIVLVTGALLYAPWWWHLHTMKLAPEHKQPNPTPALTSSFFVPAVPGAIATPWRPHFTNRVFSMTYAEIWGDYFCAYEWQCPPPPSKSDQRQLIAQSALGIVPTVLAVAGWLLLAWLALTRARELLPVALLPGVALAGYLWYTSHDLSRDGDVIKATYIVSTAPAWALAFACAFTRLPRRAALALGALLVVSALVDLRFLVYGSPLGFL
jgi:hypothetical protein